MRASCWRGSAPCVKGLRRRMRAARISKTSSGSTTPSPAGRIRHYADARSTTPGIMRDGRWSPDVMAALVAGIHVFDDPRTKTWMAGTSPTMTAILDDPYPRSAPPVRLATSATILAASASISASVMVRSRGWRVTAIAPDFLPFVEVEHGDAGDELAVGRLRRPHDVGGVDVAVDDKGEIALDRLKQWQFERRLGARAARFGFWNAFQHDLKRDQRPFGVERFQRPRMQFAEMAEHILRPDLDRAGAAGMKPRRSAGRGLQRLHRRAGGGQGREGIGFGIECIDFAVVIAPMPA